MTDESKNTGGEAQAETGAAESSTNNETVQTSSNTGVPEGVQKRLDAMTARTKTAEEKAVDWEAKYNAEREKSKSEQEKAMDMYATEKLEQFRVTEHTPVITERDTLKGAVESVVESLKQQIPEDRRPDFSSLPLAAQLDAYGKFVEGLDISKSALTAVDSGGNPTTKPAGRKWKLSEINAGRDKPEWWREHREDILQAQKEGRILLNE
jgi:hypothetical protein